MPLILGGIIGVHDVKAVIGMLVVPSMLFLPGLMKPSLVTLILLLPRSVDCLERTATLSPKPPCHHSTGWKEGPPVQN